MADKTVKVYPKKLIPPPEVKIKEMERRKNYVPKNPVLRFLKFYFGEGI